MSQLPDSVCDELGQSFRRILRDAGVKGILAGDVADLIDAVELVLSRSTLSTEEVAAAITRDGGFMRVGEASAWIDGYYVPPGALVDALMHLRRAEISSPGSTESTAETES
jgi:hypothetical protein